MKTSSTDGLYHPADAIRGVCRLLALFKSSPHLLYDCAEDILRTTNLSRPPRARLEPRPESVLRCHWDCLQVSHPAGACGLSAFGFLGPVVYIALTSVQSSTVGWVFVLVGGLRLRSGWMKRRVRVSCGVGACVLWCEFKRTFPDLSSWVAA